MANAKDLKAAELVNELSSLMVTLIAEHGYTVGDLEDLAVDAYVEAKDS